MNNEDYFMMEQEKPFIISAKLNENHKCVYCMNDMEKMTALGHEFHVCRKCKRFLMKPELEKDHEIYAQAIFEILDREVNNN